VTIRAAFDAVERDSARLIDDCSKQCDLTTLGKIEAARTAG
jgi:hypothetical protein